MLMTPGPLSRTAPSSPRSGLTISFKAVAISPEEGRGKHPQTGHKKKRTAPVIALIFLTQRHGEKAAVVCGERGTSAGRLCCCVNWIRALPVPPWLPLIGLTAWRAQPHGRGGVDYSPAGLCRGHSLVGWGPREGPDILKDLDNHLHTGWPARLLSVVSQLRQEPTGVHFYRL